MILNTVSLLKRTKKFAPGFTKNHPHSLYMLRERNFQKKKESDDKMVSISSGERSGIWFPAERNARSSTVYFTRDADAMPGGSSRPLEREPISVTCAFGDGAKCEWRPESGHASAVLHILFFITTSMRRVTMDSNFTPTKLRYNCWPKIAEERDRAR